MESNKKRGMASFPIPILKGKEAQRFKRNKNRIKRQNAACKNKILTQTPNPKPSIVSLERNSRSETKSPCNNRNGSIPNRGEKLRCETIKVIHGMEESKGSWLHPFIGENTNSPVIEIKIDGKTTNCTVDSGATRVMITSAIAKQLFGTCFENQLQKYPSRQVHDAQGNIVKVLGYRKAQIELGNHLKTEYPVVIYEADHQEILLGYTFLLHNNLNLYAGKGIGTEPIIEVVKRINATNEKMECTPMENEVIPPKATKTVKVKLWMPDNWGHQDRVAVIGSPILIHSEDLEEVSVTQLTCPYIYDLIGIDHTATALIDNSDNADPLYINKNEIIAHGELVHQEAPPDQINRIIKDSSYSINQETQAGEYKLQDEEPVNRFEYIEKINVKSNEPGTEEFAKELLRQTESFWSKHPFELGAFDKKARITLKNTNPIYDKYRPINPNKERQAQEIVDQLERHKIISRANSPYCSQPVWCWKKPKDKGGKNAIAGEADLEAPRALRLALDYRRINKVISSHCHFPNPSIKTILFKLRNARYISIMDLTNSYWQIELEEATKPILAFQTSQAQYVWNRLPQGTAPSMAIMAEGIMDTIQTGGIANICTCYVDNIIVASDSLEQHKKDLEKSVKVFEKRGWKANPAKSHVFINTECRLFGFHIDLKNQTIGPDPQKVAAILELPPATNQKSARSICGTVNYYSDLIPDLASLMSPIHESTKDGKFNWTEECQANFEMIKKKLAKLPAIHMVDFNKEMHLFCDAAQGQYIGWHIDQYKESIKKYVPVAWGSHKLNKNEQSMSQAEAELFAIVHSITTESLLLGFSKVIVHTDCKSLTYLFRFAKICSKLTRWQLILSSYDLEIYFEPSDSLGIIISDMLSRRPEKRVTNRRPKPDEIEILPKVDFSQNPKMSLPKARERIMVELAKLPPLTPEIVKYFEEKYTPEVLSPENMTCNSDIVKQVAKSIEEIDNPEKNYYNQKYVYTQDQQLYKNDVSPSGRLINLVLQEAPGLSLEALRLHQMNDPIFGPIIKELQDPEKLNQKEYAMKNGILLRESSDPMTEISFQVCVPKSLSLDLIHKFHSSVFGAHPDLKKLMTNLKRRFYIKNLKNECMTIIKKCQICTLNKSFNVMKQPYGTKIKVTGPRQVYALDICTVDQKVKEIDPTLPTSFLIITDCWCLYTLCIPINADATSREVLEAFSRHIIQPFGLPRIGFVTDGGKNFSNKLSNTFSAVLGLQQFRISPYNARANPAERINRAILAGLRYASQQFRLEPEVFKNLINYTVLAWNTSVLSHINFSPYQLFLSTPYEPAALTSFVTIHEAEKDYGDFIQGLVKTQHIVENIVNKKFQETRDKRYQDKEAKSKRSIYRPGMQVMIKKREDNTKRAHKLRPRYLGPYKVTKEYEQNCEVIPWWPDRKVGMIHKYKNEARNIPKFEKYLISKDRLKPCDDLTFYFDEGLARRFYQEFWDLVRDTQPVQEIERHVNAEITPERTTANRPSSMIRPSQIGIPNIPIPRDSHQIPKPRKGPKKKPPSSHSRNPGNTDSEDDSSKGPSEANYDFNEQNSEPENNSEEEDNGGLPEENQENIPFQEIPQERDEWFMAPQPIILDHQQANEEIIMPINRPYIPAIQYQPQGWQQGEVYQRLPLRHPIQMPQPRVQQPQRPTGTTPKTVRNLPRPVWVTRPTTSVVMGVEGSDKIVVFNQAAQRPQISPTIRRPPPTIADHTRPPNPASSRKQGTVASAKTKNPIRMDPALKEALTSDSKIFQDPEFDMLKEYHKNPSLNVEQEIQNISDNIEQNFQEVEANIENILAEDDGINKMHDRK